MAIKILGGRNLPSYWARFDRLQRTAYKLGLMRNHLWGLFQFSSHQETRRGRPHLPLPSAEREWRALRHRSHGYDHHPRRSVTDADAPGARFTEAVATTTVYVTRTGTKYHSRDAATRQTVRSH